MVPERGAARGARPEIAVTTDEGGPECPEKRCVKTVRNRIVEYSNTTKIRPSGNRWGGDLEGAPLLAGLP